MDPSPGMGDNTGLRERFRIVGDVGSPVFQRWIRNHADRLGVDCHILSQTAERLDFMITGPAELVDAMALGCSLGPQEVMVDDVQRLPHSAVAKK